MNLKKMLKKPIPLGFERIDHKELQCENGRYLSRKHLAEGDIVYLTSGEIGIVLQIQQQNYLPRYFIVQQKGRRRWTGKTKIMARLRIPKSTCDNDQNELELMLQQLQCCS